jgi:hypothetical protein
MSLHGLLPGLGTRKSRETLSLKVEGSQAQAWTKRASSISVHEF